MKTTKVSTYKGGKDTGYIGLGQNWWFNPDFKDSFSIFDLDTFYQSDYFAHDHVNHDVVEKYVDYVLSYGKKMLGRDVKTILEVGCAGGWFTEEFVKRGIDVFALEGSKQGAQKTIKRIGKEHSNQVMRHDLRLPIHLDRQFDIAVCTEVAEHIEPPFSSQLVQTLTQHAKVIWFSFEPPSTNEQHYHHSNEQPEKFWQNLFMYYHFMMLRLPGKIYTDTEGRGGYIFYHESMKVSTILKQYMPRTHHTTKQLSQRTPAQQVSLQVGSILLFLSHKLQALANRFAYPL